MRPAFPLALLILIAGCATPPPRASAPSLAPAPPGWLAFCNARGGDPATCDPIPPAGAMPDAGVALTPAAWSHYCRRAARDIGCRR